MDAILIFLMYFGVPAVLIFAIYQAILFFNRAAEKREIRRTGGQNEEEQLLFVLKYQPQRVAWRVFWTSVVGIPVGLILTFNAHLAKTGFNVMLFIAVGSLILIASIFQIIDSLFFKEVRVYKDRILKVWHLPEDKAKTFFTEDKATIRSTVMQETISYMERPATTHTSSDAAADRTQ